MACLTLNVHGNDQGIKQAWGVKIVHVNLHWKALPLVVIESYEHGK